ncbi:MAG TPA: ABC transporter ATP-binding protein [Actinomycetota bacterium]|nr:ABC transporter ATP-binding protein [Actinomycetota bacterium]
MATDPPLLDVRDIHVFYGVIEAVKGVSLHVRQGEVVTLIGSNGAGKTTTLRAISGLNRPKSGQVLLEGEPIHDRPPHEIVSAGICQAPEGRHVFPRMSVLENLQMGAYTRRERDLTPDLERVHSLFPVLAERTRQAAGTLSGGEQQMLAIGRALMARPRVLLLDEPSLGVAPLLVERIYRTLKEVNAQGTTILLVEQNANVALDLAHRGYVMETGSIVLEDEASALRASPQVRRAYLGDE